MVVLTLGWLFFDIETKSFKGAKDALNPHMPDAGVIVIAYKYYPGFTPSRHSESENLTAWNDNDEKDILMNFYGKLTSLSSKDKYLKLVGFNILNFDLPYLYSRMFHHSVASAEELYETLIRRPYRLDLAQVGAIFSPFSRKHGEFGIGGQKDLNKYFNIPLKSRSGSEINHLYHKGKYEEILKYEREEFTFCDLYFKIKNALIEGCHSWENKQISSD